MSQEFLIKMACTTCKNINYRTRRNKKARGRDQSKVGPLELKKFCSRSSCRQSVMHKETRK